MSDNTKFITTGINRLDYRLKGLPLGEVAIIGGNVGSGKTFLGVNIAVSNYLNGKSILYITDDQKTDVRRVFMGCLKNKCGGDDLDVILATKATFLIEQTSCDEKITELIEENGEEVQCIVIDGRLYSDNVNYVGLADKFGVSIILIRPKKISPRTNGRDLDAVHVKRNYLFGCALLLVLNREGDMIEHNFASIKIIKTRYGSETDVEINFNPTTYEIS
jgi:hypothetical protein